jgi:N-acetyl-gamma-glutamyl-phosphate reductase
MAAKIFIDGEAGTTGLQIRERLTAREDIDLISIDAAHRKDASARAEKLNAADVVILCLPDDAAREAVSLITNPKTKVIDASTAHRTAAGWTYGFPEMAPDQKNAVAAATRVSNPGCWATGAIALLRPLVDAGVMAANYPVTLNGVSGYSGGGKAMITEFEDKASPTFTDAPYRIYGLDLAHKHLPEIQKYTGLREAPVFSPSVGRYAQGMLVELPLYLSLLSGGPALADLHAVLARAYAGSTFVKVAPPEEAAGLKTVVPTALNGTNTLRLYVFGSQKNGQARLVAQLDNLGKGASGAAVQNLNIMLGLPEAASLS